MKKKTLIIIMMFFVFLPLLKSQEKKEDNTIITRKFKLDKAYVFKAESLLIGEAELYYSYFIDNIESDYKIIGAADQHYLKINYSDFDELYINRGFADNIGVGDRFQIIGEGDVVHHPFNHRKLGNVYVKKGLCTVVCVYETKATVRIDKVGNPVNIGDILIPYKKQEIVFEKRPDYKRCKLPETKIYGEVVYIGDYLKVDRDLGSNDQLVSVDLGQEFLKKGDYLLFYYQMRKDFPTVITGIGIVVSSHNTNSMVKILDSTRDIYIGDNEVENTKVVPLLVEKFQEAPAQTITKAIDEKTPVVTEKLANEAVYEKELYYGLDSVEPRTDMGEVIVEVKNVLDGKSEYIIILRGYTCTIGRLEYNLKLSQKRVEYIKSSIINKLGIKDTFIETYYYGEKDCKFDNTNEMERQKNRRVILEVRAR
jgi:outer membrane protein OmpA-like peptidoglycan-associated protein